MTDTTSDDDLARDVVVIASAAWSRPAQGPSPTTWADGLVEAVLGRPRRRPASRSAPPPRTSRRP